MRKHFCLFLLASIFYSYATLAQNASAKNPVVHADVPDMSMIRVGDTYYMSSTTMHMAPGVPIMKSKDLVNWELGELLLRYTGRCGCTELEQW